MYVLAGLVMRSTLTIEQGIDIPLSNNDDAASQAKNSWTVAEPENEYSKYFKEKYPTE